MMAKKLERKTHFPSFYFLHFSLILALYNYIGHFSKLAINREQNDILTPNFYYHVWALYMHRIVLVWIRFKW